MKYHAFFSKIVIISVKLTSSQKMPFSLKITKKYRLSHHFFVWRLTGPYQRRDFRVSAAGRVDQGGGGGASDFSSRAGWGRGLSMQSAKWSVFQGTPPQKKQSPFKKTSDYTCKHFCTFVLCPSNQSWRLVWHPVKQACVLGPPELLWTLQIAYNHPDQRLVNMANTCILTTPYPCINRSMSPQEQNNHRLRIRGVKLIN